MAVMDRVMLLVSVWANEKGRKDMMPYPIICLIRVEFAGLEIEFSSILAYNSDGDEVYGMTVVDKLTVDIIFNKAPPCSFPRLLFHCIEHPTPTLAILIGCLYSQEMGDIWQAIGRPQCLLYGTLHHL